MHIQYCMDLMYIAVYTTVPAEASVLSHNQGGSLEGGEQQSLIKSVCIITAIVSNLLDSAFSATDKSAVNDHSKELITLVCKDKATSVTLTNDEGTIIVTDQRLASSPSPLNCEYLCKQLTLGVSESSFCAPTAPRPPSNAGGIAASIIVVLMLLASTAVILYFYLRVREKVAASTQGPSEISTGFSNQLYDTGSTVSVNCKKKTGTRKMLRVLNLVRMVKPNTLRQYV